MECRFILKPPYSVPFQMGVLLVSDVCSEKAVTTL
jgi:hypothetical protein